MIVKYGVAMAMETALKRYFSRYDNMMRVYLKTDLSVVEHLVDVMPEISWASKGAVTVEEAKRFEKGLQKCFALVDDFNKNNIKTDFDLELTQEEYNDLSKLFYNTLEETDGHKIVPDFEKWVYGWMEEEE